MAQTTRLKTAVKTTGAGLGSEIENLTKKLQKDVRQGQEDLITTINVEKQRFNAATNYVFCYHENFHNLIVKLKPREIKVASALIRLCEFGNLVNISKQLIAEVADIHPSHMSTVFRGLIKFGFLVEKSRSIRSLSGKETTAKATFINPVFITKGVTDMFVGKARAEEGVTIEEGIQAALKAKIAITETFKHEKKVEKISKQIKAKKLAQEQAEKEFKERQLDLLEALQNTPLEEAIKEHILDAEEEITF